MECYPLSIRQTYNPLYPLHPRHSLHPPHPLHSPHPLHLPYNVFSNKVIVKVNYALLKYHSLFLGYFCDYPKLYLVYQFISGQINLYVSPILRI